MNKINLILISTFLFANSLFAAELFPYDPPQPQRYQESRALYLSPEAIDLVFSTAKQFKKLTAKDKKKFKKMMLKRMNSAIAVEANLNKALYYSELLLLIEDWNQIMSELNFEQKRHLFEMGWVVIPQVVPIDMVWAARYAIDTTIENYLDSIQTRAHELKTDERLTNMLTRTSAFSLVESALGKG